MLNDIHFLTYLGNILTLRKNYFEESGFTFATHDVDADETDKWLRVYSVEITKNGSRRESIHSFIAKMDFETKGLGKVAKGDVMKPASYKVPAKHARGNIYDDYSGAGTCDQFGPGYLRN